MDYSSYRKIIGVIHNIQVGESCCTQMLTVRTGEGMVNLIVSGDTVVIDRVRLRRGMRIAAFYDGNLPVRSVYPPRYQAEIVTVLRRNQDVALGYFDENLTAADQSLTLNLSPMTNVETMNGQRFLCSPGNSDLLVYYTSTTRSLPPQTTPQRVIVLCVGD